MSTHNIHFHDEIFLFFFVVEIFVFLSYWKTF